MLSTDVHGSANDGDSANPPAQYRAPGSRAARDNDTRAESTDPTANSLSGSAHAVPTNPGAPTVTDDEAIAASYNKVVTDLRVTKEGAFTFDIQLDVEDVELIHDGRAYVSVRANVLDSQGNTIPNAAIASLDLEFRPSPGNPHEVVINSDEDNPDQAEADGDYSRTLSGPNQGIQLAVDTYRIEFELRIRVHAPVLTGDDGRKHEAHVPTASSTITLR